jgi:phosphatidylethanolamine/phosphatidyl-N-methylethanolamine N-methyltransferase
MLKRNLTMLLGCFEEFKNTGSAFNSSKWAARALTDPMSERTGPINIIEVGAGTGPVTAEIIKRMMPGDHLTVVEINPKFMSVLKEHITALPEYAANCERITFFEGPVQLVPETKKFDIVVCALPFLNFDMPLVEEIFEKFNKLANADAIMTHYEYIGLRKLGKVVSKERAKRAEDLECFFRDIGHKRLIGRKSVWLNVTPIYIYTLHLPVAVTPQHTPLASSGH